jgi:hypothetical protein
MKFHVVAFTVLCLALGAIPASGQYLYTNGSPNLNDIGWAINFGYAVSDSFTSSSAATAMGFDMWVWEAPADKALSVDWSITSAEFGGTTYGSGTASVTDTFLTYNQYGYQIDELTGSTGGVALGAGTYWLNLSNAVTQSGGPLWWDENSGPSQASENTIGTIPSESFDVTAYCTDGANSPDCGPPTPEPGSLILFGSGIVGLAGLLRRRLFQLQGTTLRCSVVERNVPQALKAGFKDDGHRPRLYLAHLVYAGEMMAIFRNNSGASRCCLHFLVHRSSAVRRLQPGVQDGC